MAARAGSLPPDWERVSQEWRQKQLEYTWVRSLAGPPHHRDFWHVTREALDYVAARHRVTDPETRAALLDAYRRLPAYPDAAPALRRLRGQGARTAILSNGEPRMLGDAVRAAGLADLLDAVLSAEEVGVFKPDPRVYQLAADRLGAAPGEILFVSSNAWDAYGALSFGFEVAWCNRAQGPDEYGLRGRVQEIAGLDALAA
jgi:2-haloacid dehalogenase